MQISMKKVILRESDLLTHLGTFQYFNWSSDINLNDIKLSFFVEPDLNGFISLFPSWLMFFVVFVVPVNTNVRAGYHQIRDFLLAEILIHAENFNNCNSNKYQQVGLNLVTLSA